MRLKPGHILLLSTVLFLVGLLLLSTHTDNSSRARWVGDDYICSRCSVFLIVSDSLRADALGCYGAQTHTPHLDRLARQGLLFERAYSNASWTPPSTVAMFTGDYPRLHRTPERFNVYHVADSKTLLAERLRQDNYAVRFAAETNLALRTNSLQGYDRLLESTTSRDRSVLEFLENQPTGDPFLLLKWMLDPHAPYAPPERYLTRIEIDRSQLPRDRDFYTRLTFYRSRWQLDSEDIDLELTEYENQFLRRLYDKEVESVDERVGVMLQTLERRGLLKSTIVVFTSDHGEEFFDHGSYLHGGTFYEEMVHIPLIVAGPGLPKNRRISAPVMHVDIMPTLADFLDVRDIGSSSGESFEALVSGAQVSVDRLVYIEGGRGQAVVKGEFKLIQLRDGSTELFNLATDPGESVNLTDSDPRTRSALQNELLRIDKLNEQLQRSAARRQAEVDLEQIEKATLEELRALGYVE